MNFLWRLSAFPIIGNFTSEESHSRILQMPEQLIQFSSDLSFEIDSFANDTDPDGFDAEGNDFMDANNESPSPTPPFTTHLVVSLDLNDHVPREHILGGGHG